MTTAHLLGWRSIHYESSDEEDFVGDKYGPIKLANGKYVCAGHGLRICGICCVDYVFEDSHSEDVEDEDGAEFSDKASDSNVADKKSLRALHLMYAVPKSDVTFFHPMDGLTFGSQTPSIPGQSPLININPFIAPAGKTPEDLFNHSRSMPRLRRKTNLREFLVYTDGACSNNGQQNSAAGWAFVYNVDDSRGSGCSGRLENKGPSDVAAPATSNRAELRAVIAALEFRHWPGEGFQRMIIATDSSYVVLGITQHISKWTQNGWKTAKQTPVANRDLWEYLLAKIRGLSEAGQSIKFAETGISLGFEVLFWLIPRNQNQRADALAKAAVAKPVCEAFAKTIGLAI